MFMQKKIDGHTVEGQISDYFGTRHGKHYGIDVGADWHACGGYPRW